MRILLYTGKGGVGKTSVAAATALNLAQKGKCVLIMSTDQAHSLGDSFDHPLGSDPVNILPGLDALEIDAPKESEAAWGNLKDFFKQMLTAKSGASIEAEELLAFPGFEELISLFKIQEIYDAQHYEVLIVDCAPTGETLSLLKYPEMFSEWMTTLLPMKRKALKVAGPAVEKLTKIPMPKENIFDEIELLYEKMVSLHALLTNHQIVSLRIVTTPEQIVIKEAKRNFTWLHLYHYNVDALIVNRIYPDESLTGYFSRWLERQKDALTDIDESFAPLPILKLPLFKTELRGLPALTTAGNLLYATTDPAACLFKDTLFTIEKRTQGYCLILNLPFLTKDAIDLSQKGDELILQLGTQRHRFTLPGKLSTKNVTGAEYKDDRLILWFE